MFICFVLFCFQPDTTGFYNNAEEYYTHMKDYQKGKQNVTGYDFRNGDSVAWEYAGIYSTYVFDNAAQDIIRSHDPNTVSKRKGNAQSLRHTPYAVSLLKSL